MKILVRICYFCSELGKTVQAVAYYSPQPDETYDLCEEHKEICKKEKFNVLPLDEADQITQKDEPQYPLPAIRKFED